MLMHLYVSSRDYFGWGPMPASGAKEPGWVLDQQGWIPGLLALGCVLGSLPSGYLTNRFGRKGTILGMSLVFSLGAFIQLFAKNIDMLYAGRFICGVAVGTLSMAATLYQSETAPSSVRGLVISIQQLAITFGILLAASLNVALQYWVYGWRVSYGGTVVFSLAMFGLMTLVPESPRWLASKNRDEEAIAAMRLLRQEEEVIDEMEEIADALEHERRIEKQGGSWADLFSDKGYMWYRTFIGFSMQFLQQFTGINAVM